MPKVKHAASDTTASRKAGLRVWPKEPEGEVKPASILFGFLLLAALIVAAAAWMGGSMSLIRNHVDNSLDGAARNMGFAVQDVSVLGVDEPLAQLVRDAAMVEPGENMFRADPYVVRRRVEATRQVRNVKVHRLWPDQVVVVADPAEPVALWRDTSGDWAVVDSFGRIMPGVPASDHPSLIRVAGDGAAEASPGLVHALSDNGRLGDRIVLAERIAERRWNIVFDTGMFARLPHDDALEDAVKRLAMLQSEQLVIDRSVAALDLRATGKTFLARGEERPADALAMVDGAG
ncbi:MAG: cell division protein FtsQ/DivIB [Pseudomonadota bacterium]